MHCMRWIVGATTALCACGAPDATGGPLSGHAPFLASVSGPVRSMVVTAIEASRQAGTAATCDLVVDAFDTVTPAMFTVVMTAGECTLYAAGGSLMIAQQTPVCIGALNIGYPGHDDADAVCPTAGHVPANGFDFTLDCASLGPSTAVRLASGDDGIPGDTVTDLDVSVAMPSSRPALTQPTGLGVLTWPASGDLAIAWTGGAGATSALVTVTPVTDALPMARIVCQPRTDGSTSIPGALLDASGLRMQDALLTVTSYRDTTTTAEGGTVWNASAGLGTVAMLDARR